jgi:hypothetical protein
MAYALLLHRQLALKSWEIKISKVAGPLFFLSKNQFPVIFVNLESPLTASFQQQ